MQITISLEYSGDILSIDVPESLSLPDFKAYLQAETNIEPKDQHLKFNSKTLDSDNKTLQELGIVNNDLIVMNKKAQPRPQIQQSQPPSNQVHERIEMVRQQVLTDPQALNNMRMAQPSLYNAVNDPIQFRNLMVEQVKEEQRETSSNQQELLRLQQDPDNPENQKRILELIQQEAIEENMKLAWDISPESFTSVNMLHLKLKINGVEQIAMVDSGAAMTTISSEIAEKCGISRLVDKRFQGQAVGVGTQNIGGKIHSVPIEIAGVELPCSFYIVDTSVGILFGLDMLRRHRCVIDLTKDTLLIGGHIEAKFLTESEMPRNSLGGNIFSREA
ncbi:DDI1 [Candida pseudojiufengensis]|uniref:DDI1 n=1 Tax=Candida pseudojiufengensis TaxID=497109 RepID=UPI002225080C|nr:DDI1 [Candida pseudojiufengensis]KAI5962292.1 DDI1 [Candida pseudojiufengensis]